MPPGRRHAAGTLASSYAGEHNTAKTFDTAQRKKWGVLSTLKRKHYTRVLVSSLDGGMLSSVICKTYAMKVLRGNNYLKFVSFAGQAEAGGVDHENMDKVPITVPKVFCGLSATQGAWS